MATLGELFDAAYEHFIAAEFLARDGFRDHAGAASELLRLTSVMTRYLGGLGLADAATGRELPDWAVAVAKMRDGTRSARACLGRSVELADLDLPPGNDPAVIRLGRAVDAIIAGSDLMWSHYAADQAGNHVPRSDWAPLLVYEPVVLTAADEVAGWARRAAGLLNRLTQAPGQVQGISIPMLEAAGDWLSAVTATPRTAENADFDVTDRRELLRALPTVIPPLDRVSVADGESDAELSL